MYVEWDPPLRATKEGFPVIILGSHGDMFLIVESDGRFSWAEAMDLSADFRYDFDKQEWVDTSDG